MNVLLVNGSPHEKGSTYTALCEVARGLNEQGVDAELFWIGDRALPPCSGCNVCRSKLGKCKFDDCVNVLEERIKTTDGFVFLYTGPFWRHMRKYDMLYGSFLLFYSTPLASVQTHGCRRLYTKIRRFCGMGSDEQISVGCGNANYCPRLEHHTRDHSAGSA